MAAYVQPHSVDRLYKLREDIKQSIRTKAHAIYAAKSNGKTFDYQQVFLVGHSLGSVIAYETLNRLLLNDAAAQASQHPLMVASRTRLLLTSGSPLDKIAFVFSTKRKRGGTTEAREALTTVVQPLIEDSGVRQQIPWINVLSYWDIISGRLRLL